MFLCFNGGLQVSKEPPMIVELERQILGNVQAIPKKPLCILLSGGIDSSLVLALVRKTYPQITIHTFTLAMNSDYPDIIYAREVSKLFHTFHHEKILTSPEIERYTSAYETIRQHNFRGDINVFILCSIARNYSKVIVTGDGGDECFGGYWLHKHPLGHLETGQIRSFEEIHPDSGKHLQTMVNLGFRDFHYKEKSAREDFESVWEYFVKVLLPNHMEPLLHTAEVLGLEVYTPLYSKGLIELLRNLSN